MKAQVNTARWVATSPPTTLEQLPTPLHPVKWFLFIIVAAFVTNFVATFLYKDILAAYLCSLDMESYTHGHTDVFVEVYVYTQYVL